jgi:hypothetical protein
MGIESCSARSGETGEKNSDRLGSVCPLQASRDALFAKCFAISRTLARGFSVERVTDYLIESVS